MTGTAQSRLTGIELSGDVRIAKRRQAGLGRGAALRLGDAQRLEFEDESFDTVVSTLAVGSGASAADVHLGDVILQAPHSAYHPILEPSARRRRKGRSSSVNSARARSAEPRTYQGHGPM